MMNTKLNHSLKSELPINHFGILLLILQSCMYMPPIIMPTNGIIELQSIPIVNKT
jgi:hypothetical protein